MLVAADIEKAINELQSILYSAKAETSRASKDGNLI